jgi:hypothetical protein
VNTELLPGLLTAIAAMLLLAAVEAGARLVERRTVRALTAREQDLQNLIAAAVAINQRLKGGDHA